MTLTEAQGNGNGIGISSYPDPDRETLITVNTFSCHVCCNLMDYRTLKCMRFMAFVRDVITEGLSYYGCGRLRISSNPFNHLFVLILLLLK